VWEIILLLAGVVVVGVLVNQPDGTIVGLLVGIIVLMLFGLGFVPLRGRMLQNAHTSRMLKLQNRYLETLSGAAEEQIDYGVQLREDTVEPLLSLIEAQTETQSEQLEKLQSIQQQMVEIESSLADMGKSRLLAGLRNN
jgi:uncharacterized protein HemX